MLEAEQCFSERPSHAKKFTCLKQSSVFLSVLLMQSIFGKHQKPFGLNAKSNREGFDTSPCLPVARKVCEPIPFVRCSDVFFVKCQRF